MKKHYFTISIKARRLIEVMCITLMMALSAIPMSATAAPEGKTIKNDPVWFITGANKGLGAAITKEALSRGYKVVATARNPESATKALGNSPNLLVAKLDITNDEQVQAAVKAALEKFGRIDVLVNNAGYGQLGFFEETSEKLIRQQFETNVFGTMKVTRAVLPVMRKQGDGLVIVISSTSGVRAVGGSSTYAASKFALEGWSEGMNIDLKPFGIRVMIAEPGAFRTDFLNEKASASFSDLKVPGYEKWRETMSRSYTDRNHKQRGDPAKFARALMTAANDPNPPLRIVVGNDSVQVVDQYFKGRRAEFEKWREVSSHTDYD